MPGELFEGFDHTEYQQEVEERWGTQAYASGDQWWRGMSQEQRAQWQGHSQSLFEDWAQAAARGIDPRSDEAQRLAARQSQWLASIPGTPGSGTGEADSSYLRGLGELYVADERFAAHYGGPQGAAFVSAALNVFVDRRDGLAES